MVSVFSVEKLDFNFGHQKRDHQSVASQSAITCIAGHNETGPMAYLKALRRLKPVEGGVKFKVN